MTNPIDFTRLEALTLVERTPWGGRFDVGGVPLSVTAHAPGVFRLRFGPETKPDYGLLATPEPSGPKPELRATYLPSATRRPTPKATLTTSVTSRIRRARRRPRVAVTRPCPALMAPPPRSFPGRSRR